jgi:hypothetical protein
MRDLVAAEQRLVQVMIVSPGRRVMLAEMKAARSAASLWALEALHRRTPGLVGGNGGDATCDGCCPCDMSW